MINITQESSKVIIDDWLKSSKLKGVTQRQYKSQMDLFFSQYDTLNTHNLVRFLNLGQGDKRVYHRKYAVKSFLKHLELNKLMSRDEYEQYLDEIKTIKYKIKDRKEHSVIRYNELSSFVKKLKFGKLKVIIMLCYDSFGRIEGVLKLRKRDIIIGDDDIIRIILHEKNDKNIKIAITDETYKHLKRYIKKVDKEYIFFNKDRLKLSTATERGDTKKLYDKLAYLLNKKSDKILGYTFTFHSIRRGSAEDLYESSGGDIMMVKEALGHESVATTMRYLQKQGIALDKELKKRTRDW